MFCNNICLTSFITPIFPFIRWLILGTIWHSSISVTKSIKWFNNHIRWRFKSVQVFKISLTYQVRLTYVPFCPCPEIEDRQQKNEADRSSDKCHQQFHGDQPGHHWQLGLQAVLQSHHHLPHQLHVSSHSQTVFWVTNPVWC